MGEAVRFRDGRTGTVVVSNVRRLAGPLRYNELTDRHQVPSCRQILKAVEGTRTYDL